MTDETNGGVIVAGDVREGFEAVREAFADNFRDGEEVGAAACAYLGGRKVVDLWAGIRDRDADLAWDERTLMLIRSTTKGAAAVMAAMLAEAGQLDVEAPVAEYWPEFAAEGKEHVPVKWLLSHRVGLPALDSWISPAAALSWEPVVEALASQRPAWDPGTRHGYHAVTYGYLVGEVLRRITGCMPGELFHEKVATRLDLDFWIGLPPDLHSRVGIMAPPSLPAGFDLSGLSEDDQRFLSEARDDTSLTSRALSMTRPPLDDNDPAVWGADLPAHNGIATARSVARLYAATIGEVDGQRLISAETVATFASPQSDGTDEILQRHTRFGLGFALDSGFAQYRSPTAFGHPGAGGSMGFADPERGLSFAYVMNRMRPSVLGPDPRTARLLDALDASL